MLLRSRPAVAPETKLHKGEIPKRFSAALAQRTIASMASASGDPRGSITKEAAERWTANEVK